MIWKKKKIPCSPYGGLASIYDFVMRHLDYKGWADYLEQIVALLNPSGRQTLELACGTGNMALELTRRGYQVLGTDLSEEMLNVARNKPQLLDSPVSFRRMDMRHIDIIDNFDIIICLYDSMNYLMNKQEIETVIRDVHSLLVPGGIFVYDICTETNSLRYFRDRTEREKGRGFSYWRHSYYLPSRKIQVTEFRIRFNHQDMMLTELHQQRIYRLNEILEIANGSAFDSVRFYDDQSFRPGSEDSERIHFVLQKSGIEKPQRT